MPRIDISGWPLVTHVTDGETVTRPMHLDPEHIELERVRVVEGEHGVTHLRYRVRRGA